MTNHVSEKWKDKIHGGLADKKKPSDFDKEDLKKGIKVEMEHTDDPRKAAEIAMDHLSEDPKYYDKLATIEKEGNMTRVRGTRAVDPIGDVDDVAESAWFDALMIQESNKTIS